MVTLIEFSSFPSLTFEPSGLSAHPIMYGGTYASFAPPETTVSEPSGLSINDPSDWVLKAYQLQKQIRFSNFITKSDNDGVVVFEIEH